MKFNARVNHAFCDMDGVVADFDAFLLQHMGRTFEHASGPADAEMWKFLQSIDNLYYKLDPTPYAELLLDTMLELKCPLAMLTAIPRRTTMPTAEADKKRWMKDKLPKYDLQVLIGPYSRDKFRHIKKPGDLLVDDRKDNIASWIGAGGYGLLHDPKDPMRTIAILKELANVSL